jgi:hypothetical protein
MSVGARWAPRIISVKIILREFSLKKRHNLCTTLLEKGPRNFDLTIAQEGKFSLENVQITEATGPTFSSQYGNNWQVAFTLNFNFVIR